MLQCKKKLPHKIFLCSFSMLQCKNKCLARYFFVQVACFIQQEWRVFSCLLRYYNQIKSDPFSSRKKNKCSIENFIPKEDQVEPPIKFFSEKTWDQILLTLQRKLEETQEAIKYLLVKVWNRTEVVLGAGYIHYQLSKFQELVLLSIQHRNSKETENFKDRVMFRTVIVTQKLLKQLGKSLIRKAVLILVEKRKFTMSTV